MNSVKWSPHAESLLEDIVLGIAAVDFLFQTSYNILVGLKFCGPCVKWRLFRLWRRNVGGY